MVRIQNDYSYTTVLDVDECLTSEPCLNGAKCVNTLGSYNCSCKPGYTGRHCGKGTVTFQT